MPFFSDTVLDAALSQLATSGTELRICSGTESSTPATVQGATLATVAPTYGAAGAGTPSGRKRTVTAGAGTYAAGGTAAYIALTSGSGAAVHATVALAASKAVNSGDAVNLGAFDVTFTQPTAV